MKLYLKFGLILLLVNCCNFLQAQEFVDYQQDIKDESITIDMVAVEGGQYMMGAKNDNQNRKADEKPAHEVKVDSFWMGKYEITWEQYDAFVYGNFEEQGFIDKSKLEALGIDAVTGATAPYEDMSGGMGKEKSPAVNLTQYAAISFCKWLTAKTGVFYRLPTEAEWEYVCKKGNTDAIDTLSEVAVYKEAMDSKSEITGSRKPNSLGIFDMLGNVSEWVLDQYEEDFYTRSPKDNPWNRPTELYPRVLRGGSWKDTADKICCTARQQSLPKWKRQDPQIPKSSFWHTNAPFVGFRIVRPFIQPSKEKIDQYWLEVIEDYGF